jgi:hypothetical protein
MLRSTISHCKQFITGHNRSLSAKLTAQKPRTMQQERSTFSMAGNNQAKKDWNPNLYGKFSGERAKPFLDLLSQIDFKPGMKILDVGAYNIIVVFIFIAKIPTELTQVADPET